MLLFLFFVLATGGESVTGTPLQVLEIAGTNPLVFGATILILVASSVDGLRQALQWMDSLGIIGLLVLVSQLPAETGIPRTVRWLSWLISPALLTPAWLFLTGRWLKRFSSAPQAAPSITQLESKPGV